MTEKKDNVTPIRGAEIIEHPSVRREGDPDWLTAANLVSGDFAEQVGGQPAALDGTIPDTPIPGLEESVELSRTARKPEGNETIRQVLEEARPRSRALTAIEREEQEAEAERRRIVLEQEMADLRFEAELKAKRVKPMSADSRGIQWTVLLGVVLIGAAAFAISYGAVYEVAGWTGWAQWQMILTPLLFDAGIIVFTFLSFIRMERGESTLWTFLLAEALTVASAFAQVIHTLDTSPRQDLELTVACVIATLPPLILSATSYFAGRTIFRKRK